MVHGDQRLADMRFDVCALVHLRPGGSLGAVERRKRLRTQQVARHLEALDQHFNVLRLCQEIEVDDWHIARIGAGQCHRAATEGTQVDEDDAVAMPARQPVAVGIAMRGHEDDLQVGAVKPGARTHEAIGLEHIAGQRTCAREQVLRADPHGARQRAPRQTVGFGVAGAHGNDAAG